MIKDLESVEAVPITKICTKCKEVKELTEFHKQKHGRFGLQSDCKACASKRHKENWKKDPDKRKEKIKKQKEYKNANIEKIKVYRKANAEKIAQKAKVYRKIHTEEISIRMKKYCKENIETIKANGKIYREANCEELTKKKKEYYDANVEAIREQKRNYYKMLPIEIQEKNKINSKKYYRTNIIALAEYHNIYNKSEKGKLIFKLAKARRRARKLNQPNDFIKEDIDFLYECFEGKCIVCGSEIKLCLDHYYPLTPRDKSWPTPGTVPNNMILLCNNCNSAKTNRDPNEFFTKKQLKIIAEFFETVRKVFIINIDVSETKQQGVQNVQRN